MTFYPKVIQLIRQNVETYFCLIRYSRFPAVLWVCTMKTIIIGLGNPVFGNDSIGPRVTRSLAARLKCPDFTILETAAGGLDLLELLSGFEKAIIIDAVQTSYGKTGDIYRLQPATLYPHKNDTPHQIDFIDALELSLKLGLPLPEEIVIYGIEIGEINRGHENCTPEIEQAIPICVERVIQETKKGSRQGN